MFEIVKYQDKYQDQLMDLIQAEGDEWDIYWKEPGKSRYVKSFSESITYLALADGKVCGYSRSMKDALFIYVCDLLVSEKFRGNGLGQKLMSPLRQEYPEHPVYIMSGNDQYYQKLNYSREGSIYLMK